MCRREMLEEKKPYFEIGGACQETEGKNQEVLKEMERKRTYEK